MAIEIVDFPIKNGDFPWQNVSSPEPIFLWGPATGQPPRFWSSGRPNWGQRSRQHRWWPDRGCPTASRLENVAKKYGGNHRSLGVMFSCISRIMILYTWWFMMVNETVNFICTSQSSLEIIWLVVLTILKNMSSSMGRMTSHIWNGKFQTCSKPPTSDVLIQFFCYIQTSELSVFTLMWLASEPYFYIFWRHILLPSGYLLHSHGKDHYFYC